MLACQNTLSVLSIFRCYGPLLLSHLFANWKIKFASVDFAGRDPYCDHTEGYWPSHTVFVLEKTWVISVNIFIEQLLLLLRREPIRYNRFSLRQTQKYVQGNKWSLNIVFKEKKDISSFLTLTLLNDIHGSYIHTYIYIYIYI